MPHDMAYPLLSCTRTIACQVGSDMVIIDDGSALSSATESDLVERLHQIGDRASVVEELVELEALVREVHEFEVL